MKNSFKEIVRRAMRDNPELPVRFVISSLKAKQEMDGAVTSSKIMLNDLTLKKLKDDERDY